MRVLAVGLLALAATGCAGSVMGPPPQPAARLGSAEQAVAAAERAGAAEDAEAAPRLNRARSEIAGARKAIRNGEYAGAETLLVRAESDADDAASLASQPKKAKRTDPSKASLPSPHDARSDDDTKRN